MTTTIMMLRPPPLHAPNLNQTQTRHHPLPISPPNTRPPHTLLHNALALCTYNPRQSPPHTCPQPPTTFALVQPNPNYQPIPTTTTHAPISAPVDRNTQYTHPHCYKPSFEYRKMSNARVRQRLANQRPEQPCLKPPRYVPLNKKPRPRPARANTRSGNVILDHLNFLLDYMHIHTYIHTKYILLVRFTSHSK